MSLLPTTFRPLYVEDDARPPDAERLDSARARILGTTVLGNGKTPPLWTWDLGDCFVTLYSSGIVTFNSGCGDSRIEIAPTNDPSGAVALLSRKFNNPGECDPMSPFRK